MSVESLPAAVCRMCGAPDGHRPLHGGLLVRCRACSFVWTARSLAPSAEIYDADYYSHEGYQRYFEQSRARRSESALRLAWVREHAAPRSLLEAGCAGGYFLEAARAAGISVAGIEVSGAATAFARGQMGLPVEQGEFERAAPSRTFDAVVGFHVLEHVADPHAFLSVALRALNSGGMLFLEVPNVESAAADRLGASWPALATDYHRWHFAPRTLAALVEGAGFVGVSHDTVFSRFYWGRLARWRQVRSLLLADAWAVRSLRVRHPDAGDLLRLVARKPGADPR